MIVSTIRKTMKTALKTFAEIEKTDATLIEVVIHTKNSERAPSYFYMVENVPVKDENGEIKHITFPEMLGKKFDLMNREFLAAQFLPTWFKVTSEAEKVDAKNLYIRIGTHTNEIDNLTIELSNNGQKIKDLSLEEIFMED